MIRFSAALVVVAIGVLIGGVVASSLLLVYVAIAISASALIALGAGVALKRDEIFGEDVRPAGTGTKASQHAASGDLSGTRVPAAAGAAAFPASTWEAGPGVPSRDERGVPGHGEQRPGQGVAGQDYREQGRREPGGEPVARDWPSGREVPQFGKPAPAASRRPSAPPTRADPALPPTGAPPTRADPALPPTGAAQTRTDTAKIDAAKADAVKASTSNASTSKASTSKASTPKTQSADPQPRSDGGWTYVDDASDEGPDRPSSREVAVVPGVRRYHDVECILVRFMADEDLQRMTVKEAEQAGCTPCRACQPD